MGLPEPSVATITSAVTTTATITAGDGAATTNACRPPGRAEMRLTGPASATPIYRLTQWSSKQSDRDRGTGGQWRHEPRPHEH